ncbi:helix-turn-helix domain-containing protein [Ornithinimicrobium tianjinense]|uniref:Helix-turn-helix domain-containing protein n=1 Tax=Ornithinimicrobium tianjinense TaxID=1195761 RepID=A0A917BLV3_9MICO|nr:helix-turn-helix domain-containing protein [Ornithinimicrobium tianjinense]GGF49086.1 hypothetical protein GCM10011366_16230 [Ornithinimicrobium tianjinense]
MSKFNKFIWQKYLRGASALTHAQYRVLMSISTYADETGGNAYPGNERLAADACVDERTARRSVKVLEEQGWLKVTYRGGNSVAYRQANTYQLTIPEHLTATAVDEAQEGARAARGAAMRPKGGRGAREGGPETPPPDQSTGHTDQIIDHSANSRRPRAVVDPASQAAATDDVPAADWLALRDNEEALLEWLEEGLGTLSTPEEALAESMWERAHPKAIFHKIAKDRNVV